MRKKLKIKKLMILSIFVLFFTVSLIPLTSGISITNRGVIRNISSEFKVFDVFPPFITDVEVIPKLTIVGEYVNISAKVTDNLGLADVCIFMKYPDCHWENFSIFQNKTGETFYCRSIYEMIGEYTFDIWAVDIDDNTAVKLGFSFFITDLFTSSADGPYVGCNDIPVEFHGYAAGGIEPYEWLWDFGDGHYSDEQNPVHTYIDVGVYTVVLKVTDKSANIVEDTTTATISFNQPPDAPTIDGPKSGKVGAELEYIVSCTDPEDDEVYYYIRWGCDGCTEYHVYGPYPSGADVILSHSWGKKGDYTIQAFAKDANEAESDEVTFDVSIPRFRARSGFDMLLKLLNIFPRFRTYLNL
jgi:hypothetical protein